MNKRLTFVGAALMLALVAGLYLVRPSRPIAPPSPVAVAAPSPGPKAPAPASRPALAPASTIPVSAPIPPMAPPAPTEAYTLGRPDARPVPTGATTSAPGTPAPIAVGPDFLNHMVSADGRVNFALPGGGTATGTVELIKRDAHGITMVQGRLTTPEPGFYSFNRQTLSGVAGAYFGNARFDRTGTAYRVEPVGPGGTSMLVPRRLDQVVCVGMPPVTNVPTPSQVALSGTLAGPTANAPQTHPTDIPIPGAQHGIIPLQSRPGASGVIFLDFEGGPGPWEGWGAFAAVPANVSTDQIKEVWQRVSEDYQPFNLNVTTDRAVFLAAPKNSRQRVMVTTTNNAAPGAGGVALYGSFNSTSDNVCWAFYTSGKASAEVISHEVGHTLGLSHDGNDTSEYYGGHGNDPVGWAPIMGAGYYKNLTQWSKGEYLNANQKEDDLSIITNNNNTVDYRSDDYGADYAAAGYLEIQSNNTVVNEGILETRDDVDAFRFTSAGGAVALTVTPVSQGPNTDLLAEIYDAGNNLIASNNPDTDIKATVSANLAAGDYTLRVSGVGRGDPLGDGYTDYDSLGAYLVSGTASGGVKPARFTIAENSPNGTAVGTVTPRNAHGANPVSYSITSGNAGSAFAVNSANGALTVATKAQLNFETLSKQWDDPATIELFVTIVDSVNSSLNETIRVVVTVSDVNEAPVVSSASRTLFARTRVGTAVLTVSGSDVDRFDFPTYSIVSGNADGVFAIDPASGAITVAASANPASQTTYPLVVRATDHGTPALSTDATVTLSMRPLTGTYQPGAILRNFYEGMGGNAVTDLTGNAKFPNSPDFQQALSTFYGAPYGKDNFGSTITGYLIPPTTGTYTFWIASDDSSTLRISTDANPANAVSRASLNGATDENNFDQNASQKSINLTLVAGTPYYIDARHKEGVGGDHVEVAWQGPGITRQIIPGVYLAPLSPVNKAPTIAASTMTVRRNAYTATPVGTVSPADFNPLDTFTFSFTGGTGTDLFGIDANTGRIFVKDSASLSAAASASYTLTVQAIDSGSPPLSGTGTITVNVVDANTINVAGIVRQVLSNYTGTLANFPSDPRYPYGLDNSRVITSFDAGSLGFEYFGSRIRAYVVPPTTGSYKFYISSDDESLLRISSSENPANAAQVATVNNGWIDPRSFTAQASQASPSRTLVAGNRYYIEARHRQGFGGDDLAVAWTGPGIATPTIIPGNALQPFNINDAPTWTGTPYAFAITTAAANNALIGTVSANDPEGGTRTYAILSGNSSGAFAINASTGAITVANAAALPANQTVTLLVGVQDDGLGGVYPAKSATANVTIKVDGPLEQWRQQKFGANATNSAIAGDSADPDGDGLPNLIEYALNLEPLQSGVSGLLLDNVVVGDQSYLRLTATKNSAATDVTFAIEATDDVKTSASWTSASTTVEINNATTLRARDNTSIDAANARFLRLKVIRP